MTAGELIVAILENGGSALKTSEGICVDINKQNAPFKSDVPQNERASDEETLGELCDRGLLRAHNDKLYRATDKAKKIAEDLKRLDEKRIFLYAPAVVKSFFPAMRDEAAAFYVSSWNNFHATVVMQSKLFFRSECVNRRDAEFAIEYLYREKLIENFRIVDENDASLGGLTIEDKLDLQSLSFFFKDLGLIRLAGDVSERGRRVAGIDLSNLD
ncbi:MAG: hypothetical protein IJM54_09955 [Thermoguttaceae bacterium]|nr:hypothetical protein [Thermoguttaceae bacterium]